MSVCRGRGKKCEMVCCRRCGATKTTWTTATSSCSWTRRPAAAPPASSPTAVSATTETRRDAAPPRARPTSQNRLRRTLLHITMHSIPYEHFQGRSVSVIPSSKLGADRRCAYATCRACMEMSYYCMVRTRNKILHCDVASLYCVCYLENFDYRIMVPIEMSLRIIICGKQISSRFFNALFRNKSTTRNDCTLQNTAATQCIVSGISEQNWNSILILCNRKNNTYIHCTQALV